MYRLRAAVVDDQSKEYGLVAGDVDVPNYSRTPLALSSILIASVAAGHVPTLRENVAAFETRMISAPTTQRVFARSDTVEAYAEVYDVAKKLVPVQGRAAIFDASDRVVEEWPLTLDAQTKGAGGSECYSLRVPLRISRLDPGSYALRLVAGRSGAPDVVGRLTFNVK